MFTFFFFFFNKVFKEVKAACIFYIKGFGFVKTYSD